MAVYGNVGEFVSENKDIHAYLERFEFYLDANAILVENRQKAVFLATVGASIYKLLRSLSVVIPQSELDRNFTVIPSWP